MRTKEISEERKAAERLLFRLLGLALALGFIFWLLPVVWDKLSPFIVATPLAALLQPTVAFLQKKLKMKRTAATLAPVLLMTLLLLGLTYWLLSFGIGQAVDALNNPEIIPNGIDAVRQAMNKILSKVTTMDPAVQEWLREAVNGTVSRLSAWGSEAVAGILSFTVNTVTSLPYVAIYMSFLILAMFFITKNYPDIRSYLPGGTRRKQDSNTTQLTNSAIRNLMGYLKVQGVFGLMTWIVSWIYLAIFRYPYSGLIALFAGVMELIPMVGSGLLYILWAIVALILGKTAVGIQLLILTLTLQLIRRILEPKLMSDRMNVTPLQSLIGMFVGMRLGGIVGLIAGPVCMAVFVNAIRGRTFESMRADVRCLIIYFKQRWSKNRQTAREE